MPCRCYNYRDSVSYGPVTKRRGKPLPRFAIDFVRPQRHLDFVAVRRLACLLACGNISLVPQDTEESAYKTERPTATWSLEERYSQHTPVAFKPFYNVERQRQRQASRRASSGCRCFKCSQSKTPTAGLAVFYRTRRLTAKGLYTERIRISIPRDSAWRERQRTKKDCRAQCRTGDDYRKGRPMAGARFLYCMFSQLLNGVF